VILPSQAAYWKADGTRRQFHVYIMSNRSMTLYTGVTNNLKRRVTDHKNGAGAEFTTRYRFDRLVYFETYELIVDAINREKQVKHLSRAGKIDLIKTKNPSWRDLDLDT
jgi:putative endonuclease